MDADAFWRGCPATYAAAMAGRVAARAHAYDLALFGAWQGERFQREEKLKPLKTYLRRAKAQPEQRRAQTPAEMLATFETLKASGIGMTIRRIKP